MSRPGSNLALLVFSAAALGCGSSAPPLQLMVDQPDGTAPDSIEVRIYDRFQQLATERIARPTLPGALRVTSVPSTSGQLRIVVLGLDPSQKVQTLDGATLDTPAPPQASVALHLRSSFSDGDADGVPDLLDDCPAVSDAAQKSARGFGNGPGDACAAANSDGGTGCAAGALCEDFEAPQLDATRWSVSQTTGSVVELDRTRAHTGRSSLHVHLPALTGTAMTAALGFATIKEQATVPSPLYARAFIQVPKAFGADPAALMLVEQTVSPFGGIGLQLEAGGFSMFNGLRNQSVAPAGFVQSDVWTCVEWEVTIGSAGGAQLSVDGRAQLSPRLSGDTTSTPPVGEFAIGLVTSTNGTVPARDLWIDDLVVGGQSSGCPQ